MMNWIEVLAEAIHGRYKVAFMYHDKLRVVEPHTLGETKLRAYQTWPESEAGWKLFKLPDIQLPEGIVPPDAIVGFDGPRPGYKKGDKACVPIISELP